MSDPSAAAVLLSAIMARTAELEDPLWYSLRSDLQQVDADHPIPTTVTLQDATLLLHVVIAIAIERAQVSSDWSREQAEAYVHTIARSQLQFIEGP